MQSIWKKRVLHINTLSLLSDVVYPKSYKHNYARLRCKHQTKNISQQKENSSKLLVLFLYHCQQSLVWEQALVMLKPFGYWLRFCFRAYLTSLVRDHLFIKAVTIMQNSCTFPTMAKTITQTLFTLGSSYKLLLSSGQFLLFCDRGSIFCGWMFPLGYWGQGKRLQRF